MTDDQNDKAFAGLSHWLDLSHWPLDAIPANTDAGHQEFRRRALDDALVAFARYWPVMGGDAPDVAGMLETLEIAIDERRERDGIPPPFEGGEDLEGAIGHDVP